MSAVVVRDLTFRYTGGPPVLEEMSLTVQPGERVAILGPNGSGKTTFALHLNGLLPIQAGTISIDGIEVREEHYRTIRTMVGAVFQDPDDQLFMQTVRDDVAFGPANIGIDGEARDRRVVRALDAVGATALAERTSHHLSGGEKRRVAIATVLSMDPTVLVLDEPTAGLDPVGRRELAELLVSLPQTQLIITHDLAFAASVCDRSVIVNNGRVAADSDTSTLLEDHEQLVTNRLA